jgi:hypothetical protein
VQVLTTDTGVVLAAAKDRISVGDRTGNLADHPEAAATCSSPELDYWIKRFNSLL